MPWLCCGKHAQYEADQREWQREDRVTELDQRQINADALYSGLIDGLTGGFVHLLNAQVVIGAGASLYLDTLVEGFCFPIQLANWLIG